MTILSTEDREFWKTNGYVVVHSAVPPVNCKAAEQAIFAFLEMNPNDPESWYPDPPRPGIMVEIYHHQALWDNRQYPKVHQAFAEILDTEKLWVSLDRASINPPVRESLTFKEPYLHWDMKLDWSVQLGVQGVLYLTDTSADQGAFTCIPGFHRILKNWLKSLPEGADPKNVIHERESESVSIGGKAGDLIIWSTGLPHGASRNLAQRPRVVQYISMAPPAGETDEQGRQQRMINWQQRLTGLGKNEKEKEHHEGMTAQLTPLGRKLLGVDRWE